MLGGHQVAVVVHVGDAEDLRDALRPDDLLVEDLRLAEVAREGHVLAIGDVLLREDQHQMTHPESVQLAERRPIERRPHVEAAHLGAEGGVKRLHGEPGGVGLV